MSQVTWILPRIGSVDALHRSCDKRMSIECESDGLCWSVRHLVRMGSSRVVLVVAAAATFVFGQSSLTGSDVHADEQRAQVVPGCSPVDLVLTPDETRIVTANQFANSISLVDVASGKVVAEAPCGDRPSNVAITPDGRRVLATASYSGELVVYSLQSDRLERI